MKNLRNMDKKLVRNTIKTLPVRQQAVIYLRFWGYRTIQSIANKLEISWAEANQEIDQALENLREYFLTNPPLENRIEEEQNVA